MEYSGILAGLGNPGNRYNGTRHNCGFDFVDALLNLCAETGNMAELNGKKFNSLLWRASAPAFEGTWLIAKPQTFMNDSGAAIQPIMAWYGLAPARLVVAQDELDIPAGTLRFKFGGGLAGHNGLASIAERLGTRDFYRLRIGIGKPVHRGDVINWVLGRPDPSDRKKIMTILPSALETFFLFTQKGAAAATQFAHAAAPGD